MATPAPTVSEADRAHARTLWDYHQLNHDRRGCSAAIGLGSYDLGVATFAAKLYHEHLFPVLVFSGANSPTTLEWFPRGEAVHYRDHAIGLGVPEQAIIPECRATNTGQNIEFSRLLLLNNGYTIESIMLICMPYMQRRAYATCKKQWPEIDIVCCSDSISYDAYVHEIGNEKLVIDEIVGDLQRIIEYPKVGFSVYQHVPKLVANSYDNLVQAGFDSRLLGRTE